MRHDENNRGRERVALCIVMLSVLLSLMELYAPDVPDFRISMRCIWNKWPREIRGKRIIIEENLPARADTGYCSVRHETAEHTDGDPGSGIFLFQ